jgi:hypothetical protein
MDVVRLVGRRRLVEHRPVDDRHHEFLARLEPWGVTIARRDVLSLCDADWTWVRAASSATEDDAWVEQVKNNGGLIVSIDGMQPDTGHETISLVRDALTGRVLVAEHVRSSETVARNALVAPVVKLGVKVLGTISDAQERERLALQERWPAGPPQVCPFHALRDASKTACEADNAANTAIRTRVQPKRREVRSSVCWMHLRPGS